MIIAVSSKEKDKTTIKELEARGHTCIIMDTLTADYQVYGKAGGLRVEKKADISELLKSMAGNVRYNAKKECWRAHSDGTPLWYVIGEDRTKSGVKLNEIEDVLYIKRSDIRSENQREDIQAAYEMMKMMKDKYDVVFAFVDPKDMTNMVETLLEYQPGTIYDT